MFSPLKASPIYVFLLGISLVSGTPTPLQAHPDSNDVSDTTGTTQILELANLGLYSDASCTKHVEDIAINSTKCYGFPEGGKFVKVQWFEGRKVAWNGGELPCLVFSNFPM
jgi:hypothetical protein